MSTRGALVEAVLEAARAWWLAYRPLSYSTDEHLKNPTVNCVYDAEDKLALAVAELELRKQEKLKKRLARRGNAPFYERLRLEEIEHAQKREKRAERSQKYEKTQKVPR